MTREEAKQIIATWLVSSKGAEGQRWYIEGWFDEEDVEAFRMAIEALTHDKRTETHGVCSEVDTPTETPTFWEKHQLSDIIRRADAIEAVASADETNGTVKVFTGRQVNGILSALPSAEAVQRGW